MTRSFVDLFWLIFTQNSLHKMNCNGNFTFWRTMRLTKVFSSWSFTMRFQTAKDLWVSFLFGLGSKPRFRSQNLLSKRTFWKLLNFLITYFKVYTIHSVQSNLGSSIHWLSKKSKTLMLESILVKVSSMTSNASSKSTNLIMLLPIITSLQLLVKLWKACLKNIILEWTHLNTSLHLFLSHTDSQLTTLIFRIK